MIPDGITIRNGELDNMSKYMCHNSKQRPNYKYIYN